VECDWRGPITPRIVSRVDSHNGHIIVKRELLPDGREKLILKDPHTGDFSDRVIAAG
jgi:hypothetical protein